MVHLSCCCTWVSASSGALWCTSIWMSSSNKHLWFVCHESWLWLRWFNGPVVSSVLYPKLFCSSMA
uniref:Uncharacterized protein n=1 Tax=Zea mays TaxID=4577 RepID=B4FII9_MAIZE|nr:unknown [Zea mays]